MCPPDLMGVCTILPGTVHMLYMMLFQNNITYESFCTILLHFMHNFCYKIHLTLKVASIFPKVICTITVGNTEGSRASMPILAAGCNS